MARGTRFAKGIKAGLYSFASQEEGRVMKIAAGTVAITGSQDVNTGLTQVISGTANVANIKYDAQDNTSPWLALCRINKPSGTQVPSSKGAGYMKIVVTTTTASVEASTAASVDWFAIGV